MTTEGPHRGAVNDQNTLSPTRRALLTLLALVPIPVASAAATASDQHPPHYSISRLFTQFENIVSAHERALVRIDRLEKLVVARFGYARVRLTTPPGHPAIYAAEVLSIDRHGLSGKAIYLKRDLRRRQEIWALTAAEIGLAGAIRHEEIVARAVQTIGSLLLATPATTLTGIRLKIIVLLALQQPGVILLTHPPGGSCG